MRIGHYWHTYGNYVEFILDEIPSSVVLSRSVFTIYLPDAIGNFDAVHPDRWALVLILAFMHMTSSIQLTFGISQALHDILQVHGISLTPVASGLEPFQPISSEKACVGVAFSGGMHSLVTAAVFDTASTVLIAVDRKCPVKDESHSLPPPNTEHVPDSLYYSMAAMQRRGYTVKLLQTDLQDLFDPRWPSFPFPLLAGMGVILFGQYFLVHSVCYGSSLCDPTSMTSRLQQITFRNERGISIEDSGRDTLDYWRSLFSVVGLHLDFPTCGMTDLLAVKILGAHDMLGDMRVCHHAYPACGMCLDCYYCSLLLRMHTITIHEAWQDTQYTYPEMCRIRYTAPFWLLWTKLLPIDDSVVDIPYPIQRAIAPYKQPVTQYAQKLHGDTIVIASDANRDIIRQGWVRLLNVPSLRT
jgi:hypothetical protein